MNKIEINKIIFEINEGIKYGNLKGCKNHKKELLEIFKKHIKIKWRRNNEGLKYER